MKNLRYAAEYLLARLLFAFADVLPLPIAERLSNCCADAWYVISRQRREIAIRNIIDGGICADRKAASRIARQSFRHFAMVILESIKSLRMFQDPDWRKYVEVNVSPELEKIMFDDKQGLILASGHFGSWEMAAQLMSLIKPVAGVTRRMNNPYVDRFLQKRKPRERFYLLPKYDKANTGRFLKSLKEGVVLGLMIDQHASWGGIKVDFFGRPAFTYTTVALLHLVTKAPLCFGYCRRLDRHRYELRAVGPFHYSPTGNKQADVRRIMEDLTRELEKVIRTSPEQYLWAHRRWKPQVTMETGPYGEKLKQGQ